MPRQTHDIFNVFSTQTELSEFFPTAENPALSKVRIEQLDGREYLVVPMVMLVVGVHRGSNGSIYYPPQELAYSPKQWNMKPIVIEHPFNGGSGTDLEIYKKQAVGQVMNTFYTDGKLKAEAWLDLEKVKEKCPEIIDHIQHGLPMEISTGLTSDIFADSGVWQGEPYSGRIGNIRSDHLAILPKKQGACSLSDGAGLLINAAHPDSEFPNVMHTYNAEYFPGSISTDDIAAPVRQNKPQEQPPQPSNSGVKPPVSNPFRIDSTVQAQPPNPISGNFPTGQNTPVEPMIPLSAVQDLIRDSLKAITESIKAVKPEAGVSVDTPPVPLPAPVTPAVPPVGTAAAPIAEQPTAAPLEQEPVAKPTEEQLSSGELSEEDLQAMMPEISTLIESLYHLLTKTKNQPTPVERAVQIENPITNDRSDVDFNADYKKFLDELDVAFKDSGTITYEQYKKFGDDFAKKQNETRVKLVSDIENALSTVISTLATL